MDLPLPLQLLLVEVLVRQGVFHLLEADVVHARRVHVAAGEPRAGAPGQGRPDLDGGVRVIAVVDRKVDVAVHRSSHARERPRAGDVTPVTRYGGAGLTRADLGDRDHQPLPQRPAELR